MKKYSIILFFFLFFVEIAFSQNSELAVFKIPDNLKENANAVVRLNQTDISILSQRKMNIKTKRIVTVLNGKGVAMINASEYYDKSTSVKNIEAVIFDAFGNEMKRVKRKNFKDVTAVGDGTLYSDSRLIYFEYTPTSYPFSVLYESEIETSNTAFIPQWFPVNGYFVGIEKNVLNVSYPDNLGFKKKEIGFENYSITKIVDTPTKISYVATNILPQKYEDYTPVQSGFPKLMLGLDFFYLEGVEGVAKNWKEMGKWFSDKILKNSSELSEETKSKIKALVGDEKDPIKKARIIYDYVQQKTRYVSVQEGIGGWKPMPAKDVDRLSYGDCKALSNYTKSLLDVVGVPSYYTRLYGGQSKKDVVQDFVSMQSNHVILAIPNNGDYIWLECTSQVDPFGYQGTFTDDRNVLIMKPEGGEIVRTKNYSDRENSQITKGSYVLSEEGNLQGAVSITSEGVRYSEKNGLEKRASEEQNHYYKEYWGSLNDLAINKVSYSNDKQKVVFTENVQMSVVNYGNLSANSIIFPINAFNQYDEVPHRYRTRKNPFEIERGFYDYDEIEITIPENFSIENKPENVEMKSKFGEYNVEVVVINDKKILYKRSLLVYKGAYDKAEYENYRQFSELIARNDNSKIILNKKI